MKAHANDHHAQRFGPHEFRVRPTTIPQEGRWLNQETPETTDAGERLPTCSYCGSIEPEEFLRLMATPGVHFSGCDWKYGYPHKFRVEAPCEPYLTYIGSNSYTDAEGRHDDVEWGERTTRSYNFRTAHLVDVEADYFERWNAVAALLLGIEIRRDGEEIQFVGARGTQRWGVVPEVAP